MKQSITMFWRGLMQGRFVYVLVALGIVSGLILLSPAGSGMASTLFMALMLIIAFAVSSMRSDFYITLALIVPAAVFKFVAEGNLVLIWLSVAFAVLALLYVTFVILKVILSHAKVSVDTVAGAICAYVMIGYTFGLLYCAILVQNNDAFHFVQVHADHLKTLNSFDAVLSYMLYYSFVTMTTLGYGDILPVSAAARGLAMLEAILGQLFLAVFVARLVGVMIVSEQRSKRLDESKEKSKEKSEEDS